jgi:signal transduction histidine kinase
MSDMPLWSRATCTLAVAMGCVAGPSTAETRNVLVLYSNGALLPATVAFSNGLREGLRSSALVEVQSQHLDISRVADEDHDLTLAGRLAPQYRNRRIDVVVTLGVPASAFASRFGAAIWPDARTVHASIDGEQLRAVIERGEPVVPRVLDYRRTVETALALVPGTRQVTLLAGASDQDRRWLAEALEDVAPLRGRVRIEQIANLAWQDVLREVSRLPSDAIAFPVSFFADAQGRAFVPGEAMLAISRVANRPLFGAMGSWMGSGVVGGYVLDSEQIGRQTARLVLGLLGDSSEPPELQPDAKVLRWMFDAAQMRKWGINESALPTGSVVLNRELSAWRRYQWTILGTIGVLGAQGVIIGGLLVQRRRRRRAEAFNAAVLASVPAQVAVLDRDGIVKAVNDRWRVPEGAAGADPLLRANVGKSLPALLDQSDQLTEADSQRLTAALSSVLERRQQDALVEYGWRAGADQRWSQLMIQPLDRAESGAVVAHVDVSCRKRAELEVQRAMQQLAHLNMLAGMGELVGSVAHEVCQPLAASLSNAQALRRMLATKRHDPDEIPQILDDIIAQNRRASDVLLRLRKTVSKEQFDWARIDLNELLHDTVRLVTDRAVQLGVRLVLNPAPELPAVRGNRVQLQQVIVNIVLNAMHATADRAAAAGPRPVPTSGGVVRLETVCTARDVRLSVTDSGPGIAPDAMARLFEPFFTTKPEGLGLGLSISHSIVALHGGFLTAHNPPAGGAEFTVTLPIPRHASSADAGENLARRLA